MTLGVIMLDTGFRRFPGDIGDAGSHDPPPCSSACRGRRRPASSRYRISGRSGRAPRGAGTVPQCGRRHDRARRDGLHHSAGFLVAYQRDPRRFDARPGAVERALPLPEIARGSRTRRRIGISPSTARRWDRCISAPPASPARPRSRGSRRTAASGAKSLATRPIRASWLARPTFWGAPTGWPRRRPGSPRSSSNAPTSRRIRAAIERRLQLPVHDIWDVVLRLGGGRSRRPERFRLDRRACV